MYTDVRYLYNNFITGTSMISAGSQAGGVVSGVERVRGTGSATMYAAGAFSGDDNLDYTAQIDSITPGVSVGQSTFRWKDSDSSGWEATGVTTSGTLQTLNNAVQVAWIASENDQDFTLDDTFKWFAVARFGTRNLIDLDPNTLFRSGGTYTVVIDLGSAKNVTAFAVYNHNIVAATGTITLQGNTSDAWGSPAYSQALTVTNPAILYLNETYRYWRIVPTDSAATYFQTGGIYLGDYLQLTKNAWWGSSHGRNYTTTDNENQAGVYRRKSFAKRNLYELQYPIITNTDFDDLETMQETLIDTDTGTVSPLYVHLFNDESDTLFLMDWRNITEFSQNFKSYLVNEGVSLELAERVLTRT